ncbi:MAG: hypothetical protein J0H04_07995, partial [Hyphomicrobium denitrificans]|nr:hypothetical protein [Hyphomicrobium denitrificans]
RMLVTERNHLLGGAARPWHEDFERAEPLVIYEDKIVPIGFFVQGASYRLWGLFPMDLHLVGPTGLVALLRERGYTVTAVE